MYVYFLVSSIYSNTSVCYDYYTHSHADPLDDVTVARPSECSAPILKIDIPSLIPGGPATAPAVRLHVEYTRIDREARGGDTSDLELFEKSMDAGILTNVTSLEVNVESPLSSWKIYAVRMRLEVLGVVSEQWSQYSRPFCAHCQECKSNKLV